jgi:hypothetical protein
MRTRTRVTVAVGVVVTAGVAFAGTVWVSQDHTGKTPMPSVLKSVVVTAPTLTPTPKPANPAAAGASPGDVLGVDPGTLPNGLLSYELTDGRWVVVDPSSAVPEPVVADLPVQAATGLAGASGDRGAQATVLEQLDDKAAAGTGRTVVVVYPVQALTSADSTTTATTWMTWGRDADGSHSSTAPTKDKAVAVAQAWVGSHHSAVMVVVDRGGDAG